MIRGTKAVIVIKQELERGLVQKIIDPLGLFIEYWVYKDGTEGTIDGKDGYYKIGVPKESAPERVLKCVIVTENDESHIVKDLPNHYLIKGVIFSDNEYPDLTDYLSKTERHL